MENHLSRRERQIMDILFELGEASAQDVQKRLPDPPSYSSVRALLGKLVEKGVVSFVQDGPRYIYSPVQNLDSARQNALQRLLRTFFGGSVSRAVNALLGSGCDDLSQEELDRIQAAIDRARNQRKP